MLFQGENFQGENYGQSSNPRYDILTPLSNIKSKKSGKNR